MVLYMHRKLTEIHGRSSRCTCNLPTTSVHLQCISRSFHQLSVHPWDLPSTYRASTELSVNFHQLPSTFHAAVGPSVNIPCMYRTVRQFQVRRENFCNFHPFSACRRDLPATFGDLVAPSFHFLCSGGPFTQFPVWQRYLLTTFVSVATPSVN